VEDDVSGLVIPPGDAEALAAAMHRILADKAVAARLSKEGPLRARQFTVSAVLPQIERAYETAIRTRRSKAERPGPDGSEPA
jgi:glycosyltransferase involved in cell wall biosynthesis